MAGPVGGGFPGTPVVLVLACLMAFLIVKSAKSAVVGWRDITCRKNWRADVLVATMAV
jgi:hypothetical protein